LVSILNGKALAGGMAAKVALAIAAAAISRRCTAWRSDGRIIPQRRLT